MEAKIGAGKRRVKEIKNNNNKRMLTELSNSGENVYRNTEIDEKFFNTSSLDSSSDTDKDFKVSYYHAKKQIPQKNYEKREIAKRLIKSEKNEYEKPQDSTNIYQDNKKLSRQMGFPCNLSVCNKIKTRHCYKFTEEIRQNIFNKYWKEMNWKQRKIFIPYLVNVMELKMEGNSKDFNRKTQTYQYFLEIVDQRVQVCRTMFLQTLGIGFAEMRHWMKERELGITQKVEGLETEDDTSYKSEIMENIKYPLVVKTESNNLHHDTNNITNRIDAGITLPLTHGKIDLTAKISNESNEIQSLELRHVQLKLSLLEDEKSNQNELHMQHKQYARELHELKMKQETAVYRLRVRSIQEIHRVKIQEFINHSQFNKQK